MMRRYQSSSSRFNQPDPYGGSYNLTDPQSLNRYTYTQNDPVNFVDPSGLLRIQDCTRDWWYGADGVLHYSSWRCTTIYDDGGISDPQNPNSELRDFLAANPECAKQLAARGNNLISLFTFVDTRGNEALLNTTMDRLGMAGSTLTLREMLADGGALTITGRATAYLAPDVYGASLIYGNDPEARGALFFHELFVHYALGASGHIDVARSLGLVYAMPDPPKKGSMDDRARYELEKDRAAASAIHDWISRGCK